MNPFVIWSLFDSGNGSYFKVIEKLKREREIENYSIGMDRENKNDHFINLNLADYGRMFGVDTLFDTLDQLPKPGLIIASPPCESWSVASAMANGNACWKQDTMDNLFGEMKGSRFAIREYSDFENYQFLPERQLMTRINGELCIFNTIEIIKRYQPKYHIIENPAHGRIWDYIKDILGFELKYENLVYYSNYDYPIAKPTKFGSNVDLGLDSTRTLTENGFQTMSWDYNQRSNIPEKLVEHIFNEILKMELEL